MTAETEASITNATATAAAPKRSSNPRPTTAANPPDAKSLDVSTKLPKLLEAIENETNFNEDQFQAQVCVGWLHWVVAEYGLALERLPQSQYSHDAQIHHADASSEWTTVCALKAAYLRANCLTRKYQRKEALEAFQSGLPALARVWSGNGIRKQLSYWSELYLTEFCMLSSQAVQAGETSLGDPNSLACFRSWAKYWEVVSTPLTGGYGFRGSVPRRRIWNEYYIAVSMILNEDLPFPSGFVDKINNETSARAQLRLEVKNAETTYQTLLLNETSFPRADEERAEVEDFVKLVVKNWSVLCGRGWREQDLGPGGRSSLSRGVLDILYSAATKTYHSTAILRSLFLVHISVAEFDLAFKAFDSYLELVKKGKARVDKTGHLEPSLDDDGTVLETMAQAVVALCQYGHREVADKARHLGAELEDWLARLPQLKSSESGPISPVESTNDGELHPPVPPRIVALSWQAIGLSQAHWSRITHEAASRTEIQSRAIRCLRRSLAAEFGRSKDIRSYFALSLLLAERRELTVAIEVVKTALVSSKGHEESYHLQYGPYWQERALIPMWHLLALLLSARQDYVLAARACEGALEQFKDPSVLFGKEDTFKSEHLNEAEKEKAAADARKGLVDDMDDMEKESILEVKMTQLALVELLEGPDVAVNASYELLTLFSRLFGNVAIQPAIHTPKAMQPPKTSGTLRSLRGSIFSGGKDRSRPPTRQTSNATNTTVSDKSIKSPTRPATSRTVASVTPTIQVTGEHDGPLQTRRGSASNTQGRRSDSSRRNSLIKRERSMSRHRKSSHGTVVDGESFFTPPVEPDQSPQADFFAFSSNGQRVSMGSFSRPKPLPTLNSYLSTASKSSDFFELSAETTQVSINLLPLIQFPKDKERTRRTTVLVRVWLMIAGFYRRADMHEDCKGAVTEAQKLVQTLEADAHREPFVTGSIKSAGWAESKSIEELWGDVYSEVNRHDKQGVDLLTYAQFGLLSLANDVPYTARADFESALTHAPDHPGAIVGLSDILLDVYCEKLRPSPVIPPLENGEPAVTKFTQALAIRPDVPKTLPSSPLGLGPSLIPAPLEDPRDPDHLPEPYKATCLPLVDRLAARDRAYALLSGLTRLGSGWNNSEAWFALARAHEESGQPDKAKEVLWWCIELEEARGVRDWRSLAGGGYVI